MRRRELPYRPPLDWPAMLAFLAPRATPGVEVVEDGAYRRVTETGVVDIRADARRARLVVRGGPRGSDRIVRRMFDLDADPRAIAARLGESRALARLVARSPGLRLPGAWDPFELAVRAVLGQQVTVRGATTLAGRLVRTFGRPVETGDARLSHLFPRPEDLADADVVKIGTPRARAATIRALATAVARGEPVLDAGRGLGDAVARLCALPGIGPWTAHYVAMRGLGERDAFPASDLGLRRALGGRSPRALARLAEAWRPWRAYAVMYLWKGGPMTTIDVAEMESPLGRLVLAVRESRLCALEFAPRWPRRRAALRRRFGGVVFRRGADPGGVARRLAAYFAGDLEALAGVSLDAGGTPFQRKVWRGLRRIRPGRTVSYGELARAIGTPRAVRAVGTANGANPIAIVVPCHRVIAADGRLGGYAGGLTRKQWLLAHEEQGRLA